MDEKTVQNMIEQTLKKSFKEKRIGDTPTDALQLANKNYVDTSSGYVGSVKQDGTNYFLPDGWTSSTDGAADYTITHNLGTDKYGVVFTSSGGSFVNPFNKQANSFQYQTLVPGSGNVSADADFILKLH